MVAQNTTNRINDLLTMFLGHVRMLTYTGPLKGTSVLSLTSIEIPIVLCILIDTTLLKLLSLRC